MKRNLLLIALFLISITLNAQYWSQQNTNFSDTAIGVDHVSIVDSNIVWVNGFNGSGYGPRIKTFSKTLNGGNLWTAGDYNGIGATELVTVLCGVSSSKAFTCSYDTVSNNASFWKTTDGGANWTKVTGILNNGSTTFADGVKFWDSGKGFCFGDPVGGVFDIYTTVDSGDTWTAVPGANIPPALTNEASWNGVNCSAIAPDGSGFFITSAGRVIKTINYGLNWTATTSPFTSLDGGKIYASSANYIIVSSFIKTDTVWQWKYSNDGGVTWKAFRTSGNFYQYQMCYVPGSSNMFVSSSPFSSKITGVSYSINGGLNWTDFTDPFLQVNGKNVQCLGVGFYNMNIGWVGNYDTAVAINSILKYYNPNGITIGVQSYQVNGNDVNIYPNPSTGIVNFDVNGPNKENINIRIYDVAGRMIFQKVLNVDGITNTSFDFSEFPRGLYIVNTSSTEENYTKKLIIN